MFREPVTLPSGLSYEESAIMEHFAKVRKMREGLLECTFQIFIPRKPAWLECCD